MDRFAAKNGKSGRFGIAALALAIVALPAAGALASAEDPTAGLSAEQVEQGRQIFNDWSCGTCHVLSDAGASGSIGPALDGNSRLDHGYTVNLITNGQGAMPGFGGQLTDDEIDLLAQYIVQTKK